MKKMTALVLMFSLLLTFAGCTGPQAEIPDSAPTQSNETTTQTTVSTSADSTTPIKQLPLVSVALPVIKQSVKAEDETVIFNSVYQNMTLIAPDSESADKIIIDFLQQTDISSSASAIKKQAQSDYAQNSEYWTPYLTQITYDPARIDLGVLSLFGSYASYSGTAHAEIVGRSLTYDLITGKALSLDDILVESADAEKVCSLVLNSLNGQEDLYIGYEATVKDRLSKNLLSNHDWYFSDSGLCFFFSPYEIGPFSSGIISAEIPYQDLTGILKDDYFPAERENAGGNIEISAFHNNDLNQYSQFAEVVLEEGTDKVLLHSELGVYDIRIETGSWSADGLTFTPEHTVLACYALTPGDAIMVDSPLSETLPTLRISYTTDNKTVSYFVNKADGNVNLIPA